MGIASDSRGNIWVANSDYVDVPCPPDRSSAGPIVNRTRPRRSAAAA